MSLCDKFKAYVIQEGADLLPWVLLAYLCGICMALVVPGGLVVATIGIGMGVLFGVKKRSVLMVLGIAFCVGWGNMALQTHLKQHPVLTHSVYQTHLQADVEENQVLTDRQILMLSKIRWFSSASKMPSKIRVHFRQKEVVLKAGDRIHAVVSIYPPDPSFSVGYERQLWFQKIGATGVVHKLSVIQQAVNSSSFIKGVRDAIKRRLFDLLPQDQAALASALITGEQKLVSRDLYQLYRRAGIVHVLSVSGFHMALLAAFLFFVIRHLCALFPRIVLYWNTKKWAAFVALIVTFLYLGLSGFQIPAVRAFIMIAFVFAGIFIERSVFSMRSLCLAALGILLWAPYMILSISFQLSFTAVMVLIAFYHFLQEKDWPRFLKGVLGFVGLNVLVFVALMPFTMYHFHHVLPYGILGNMLFSSLFSVLIMPLLFIGVLLMPCGGEALFFSLAGQGIQVVHWGIKLLAHLPFAEIPLSPFSGSCLAGIAFGIMLLCWMKTPLKYLILLLLGLFMWLFS